MMILNSLIRLIFIILILTSVKSNSLIAQVDTLDTDLEENIESILEETIEDADDSQINEVVEDLIQNPVEVNQAGIEDLLRIPFIDQNLATEIINYRKKYGYYFTLGELNSVKGMTPELFQKIKTFLYIDRNKFLDIEQPIPDEIKTTTLTPKKYNLQLRQRYFQNLERRSGFETGKYYNSPFKFYNRITADYSRKYYLSVLSEKDPGEKKLNDFYSASFFMKDFYNLKQFVIGDYVLEFGQGLAMWRQIGFSKGSDAVYPIKKKESGIVQYKSTDENQFFRGVAFNTSLWRMNIYLFYSNKTFDARIDTINNLITSTPTDGYHRNESELNKKNSGREKLLGSRISYQSENYKIGLTYYQSDFNYPIAQNTYFKTYSQMYNYLSTDFNLYIESLNFFGEFSKDKFDRVASIVGLQFSVARGTNIVTAFRNYPAKYLNIHGYGFGERNGATNNETGFYLGVNHSTKFGKFNLYFDQFKFNYPLTYDYTLTSGKEFLLNYESPSISQTKYLLKYKNEIKEINTKSTDEYGREKSITNLRQQQNLRFEIQKFFGAVNRVAFRVEYISVFYKYTKNYEDGLLSFVDISTKLSNKLSLKSRFIFYQTDSYDSRIYVLESDVPGVFASSGFYGRGTRWYILLRYQVLNFMDLSAKYSELYRDDVKKIGTGNDEINSNLLRSLTFQMEIKF